MPGKDISLASLIINLAWPTMAEQALGTVVQYVDTAMVGRRAVRYGRGRAVEYETETAPLMMAHALWLDQALTSPKTWLADGTPIVITDSDISVTDDRAALNTVKFTWRRADGRAHIVVEQSDRIFTEEFTRQFN